MSQDAEKYSAQAAQSGNSDGQTARSLVEQACVAWQADLMAFLLGVLKNQHQAEDVFQRLAVRALECAGSARPETLRGWLFRIALNEARQVRRQRQRDLLHFERLAEQRGGETAESVAEAGLIHADLYSVIRKSLQKLPPEQQDVIRRRIYYGQTFAEIAAELRQPLGTVLTWMRRGLLRLKADSDLRAQLDDNDELSIPPGT